MFITTYENTCETLDSNGATVITTFTTEERSDEFKVNEMDGDQINQYLQDNRVYKSGQEPLRRADAATGIDYASGGEEL